ncbi:hypothetical protein A3L11_08650 [Thermococcus siculi]|uniref:Uncharacterized protein n=1 Tax=Thermococcus siculi TaxID=72803 RepID=A0A2Z2MYS6_9EURY|nr:hypothetical protein [Thermococcus siculi]ASJ09293.1 hypothetical protein A3L11_08650 [Thermococcus siculi]
MSSVLNLRSGFKNLTARVFGKNLSKLATIDGIEKSEGFKESGWILELISRTSISKPRKVDRSVKTAEWRE